jgi:hypothetical protein
VPAFHEWRLPFYVVWILCAGVGLVVLRLGDLSQLGINLTLIAALLLSVQGLAVQINLGARFFAPWVRIVFWALAAVLFAPFVLAGSAVIGLADQWLDWRRLLKTAEQ